MSDAPAVPPPAVIVHGLDMARAALAPGLKVTLLSAPGAGIYAGVGWWRALVAASGGDWSADMLDCGDAAGRALEALRAGQRRLVLRARADVWDDIAWRAASVGALLLREPPPALDLGRPGALRLLQAWLTDDWQLSPGNRRPGAVSARSP